MSQERHIIQAAGCQNPTPHSELDLARRGNALLPLRSLIETKSGGGEATEHLLPEMAMALAAFGTFILLGGIVLVSVLFEYLCEPDDQISSHLTVGDINPSKHDGARSGQSILHHSVATIH